MPILQNAKELGLAIRSRRKELGWDQATLAKHVGVTRQWVIEIEKGKPRAELALALRALRVLGLSLMVEASPEDAHPRNVSEGDRQIGTKAAIQNIDSIIDGNRGPAARQVATYLTDTTTARLIEEAASINRLAEMAAPRLPRTAADYLKEIEALQALDPTAQSATAKAAARLVEEIAPTNRLAEMAAPRLPRTAADHLAEFEKSRRSDRPARTRVKSSPGAKPSGKARQPANTNEGVAKKSPKRKATPSGSRPRKR